MNEVLRKKFINNIKDQKESLENLKKQVASLKENPLIQEYLSLSYDLQFKERKINQEYINEGKLILEDNCKHEYLCFFGYNNLEFKDCHFLEATSRCYKCLECEQKLVIKNEEVREFLKEHQVFYPNNSDNYNYSFLRFQKRYYQYLSKYPSKKAFSLILQR